MRTFEAYARRGDITAAAELGITPSAVSHQLKSLEVFLGQALTERRGRRLALTADGRRYFEAVRPAFILLHNAAGQLRRNVLQRRVTISALPSLAAGWFIPRLATFSAQYPNIDIQVQYARYRNYASDETDVSLRFRTGDWPQIGSQEAGDSYHGQAGMDVTSRHRSTTVASRCRRPRGSS